MEGSVTGPFLCFLVLLLAAVNLLYTFGWLFQIFGRTGSWSANLARYFLLGALLLSLLAVPVIGWFNYWEMNRINRANSS